MMNFFEATLRTLEDSFDIMMKAPERDNDGIGRPTDEAALPPTQGSDKVRNSEPVQRAG